MVLQKQIWLATRSDDLFELVLSTQGFPFTVRLVLLLFPPASAHTLTFLTISAQKLVSKILREDGVLAHERRYNFKMGRGGARIQGAWSVDLKRRLHCRQSMDSTGLRSS